MREGGWSVPGQAQLCMYTELAVADWHQVRIIMCHPALRSDVSALATTVRAAHVVPPLECIAPVRCARQACSTPTSLHLPHASGASCDKTEVVYERKGLTTVQNVVYECDYCLRCFHASCLSPEDARPTHEWRCAGRILNHRTDTMSQLLVFGDSVIGLANVENLQKAGGTTCASVRWYSPWRQCVPGAIRLRWQQAGEPDAVLVKLLSPIPFH